MKAWGCREQKCFQEMYHSQADDEDDEDTTDLKVPGSLNKLVRRWGRGHVQAKEKQKSK